MAREVAEEESQKLRESLCELEWEDEKGGQKSGKPREAGFKEKAWAQNMVLSWQMFHVYFTVERNIL